SISQTANYHSPVTRSLVAAVDRNPGSSNVQFSPTPDLSPVPKMAPFKNENLNFDSKIKYDDDRRLSAEIAENCRFTTNFSDEKIFHGVNPKFGSMTPKNTGSLPRMKRPQQQQQQQLKPSEPEIVYSINAAIKMADEKNTAGAVYNRKPVPPSPALCRSAATTPQPPPPQPLPLPPRSLPPRPPRPPPPSYEETMQRRRRHRPTTPRQSASPLRPPDAPLRHPASPLRQPASPLHQRASPLHERASPLHQSASPLRQPASNVVAAADVSNQDVDFWPLPQLTTNDQDFRESLLATVVAQAKLLERQTSTLETLDKNIGGRIFSDVSKQHSFGDVPWWRQQAHPV
uniref:Uncharacterized protein n=1 Tax=Romanomermis culicivorax TaxID=13658 RepID=A0A915IGB4_ROMCU